MEIYHSRSSHCKSPFWISSTHVTKRLQPDPFPRDDTIQPHSLRATPSGTNQPNRNHLRPHPPQERCYQHQPGE